MQASDKESEGSIFAHKGVVLTVHHGGIDVAVQVEGACIGCKLKDACSMGNQKEKTVVVATDQPEAYRVGEEVIVSVGRGMGFRAILLSYIIPLVLLLVSLPALLGAGVKEAVAGLSSLGALALYYAVLWLFRSHIHRKINFKIRKMQ